MPSKITLRIPENLPKWVFIDDTPSALQKHLNKIPQYQLLPNFRGIPRPEVFLYHYKKVDNKLITYCSSGLWREVQLWLEANGYEVERPTNKSIYTSFNLSLEEFTELVKSWNLTVEPRDYQVKAAWLILKYKRSMSQLATRSGKTLIGYIVFRAAMQLLSVKKILMIVPSIQLVKQGLEDFKEYKEFFNGEEVWAKGEHVEGSNLTIGTFQSLVLKSDKRSKRYSPGFFNDYDMVLVDECHKLKAQSIQTILQALPLQKIMFGFTGTLPKENTIDWFCCQAMMGPKIQDISAMDLVKEGFLVQPDITQVRIRYKDYEETWQDCAEYLVSNYVLKEGKKVLMSKDIKKLGQTHVKELPATVKAIKRSTSPSDYRKYLESLIKDASQGLMVEQMVAQRSLPKIEEIINILKREKGNYIVFAHNTEYIGFLMKRLKEAFPERTVHKITGSDNLKKRQEILDEMLESDNNILIGSYGCVSTGITFRRIAGTILAQSFKSEIINIQSIGRLLLPEKNKRTAKVYDLIDVFGTKKIYVQGLAKIRDYKAANYKCKVIEKDAVFEDAAKKY